MDVGVRWQSVFEGGGQLWQLVFLSLMGKAVVGGWVLVPIHPNLTVSLQSALTHKGVLWEAQGVYLHT